MNQNVSVVVVCYRRVNSLDGILGAWLKQSPDVWLADCSGGKFKTQLPIKHVAFKRDPGNRARHAIALLTEGDLVIKADDDVMPEPGLIMDFLSAYREAGEGIYGLIGRRFVGPKYYGGTIFLGASKIGKLAEVDFAGVTTMAPRSLLPFDLIGCDTAIEDLFWQMKEYPEAKKYVIATRNYSNIPSSNDDECLFHDPQARAKREAFYQLYFIKNYEGRGKWTPSNI